jgi:hypothetical protein
MAPSPAWTSSAASSTSTSGSPDHTSPDHTHRPSDGFDMCVGTYTTRSSTIR